MLGMAMLIILAWFFLRWRTYAKLALTLGVGLIFLAEWTYFIHPTVLPPRIGRVSPPRPTDLTGSEWAGIKWLSYYTEVDLTIDNPSKYEYSSLDVTVSSDNDNVTDVGQLAESIPCRVIPGRGFASKIYSTTISTIDASGKSVIGRLEGSKEPEAIPFASIIKQGDRRIRCDPIPPDSATMIVLAFAPRLPTNPIVPGVPKMVKVKGSFSAANRRMPIDLALTGKELGLYKGVEFFLEPRK
jgi:hypothetical protein